MRCQAVLHCAPKAKLYVAVMSFGSRLRAARSRAGMKQGQLAEALGVSVQAVSGWERDVYKPEVGNVIKIASALGISADDLMSEDAGETLGYQQGLTAVYRAPLIDRIAAGQWRAIIADGERPRADRSFELSKRPVGDAFALQVESGSMLPEFREGDVIVIDTGIEPRPGDFVVAKLDRDDKATFKRYRPRGVDDEGQPIIELAPLNDDFPTLIMNARNPGTIVGVMIEHRRFRR